MPQSPSVNWRAGIACGLGTLLTVARYVLDRWGLLPSARFRKRLTEVMSKYDARRVLRSGDPAP